MPTINGRETNVGDKVHYITHEGTQQEAEITNLEDNFADLQYEVNGQPKQHTRVPNDISNTSHSWNHIPE